MSVRVPPSGTRGAFFPTDRDIPVNRLGAVAETAAHAGAPGG